jgi:peptide/nickel transport system ATP-binding protein
MYPHQVSGGMQQRVLIAMAVASVPKLLVLDEPTTSLDTTTQVSILDLFRDLIQGLQTSALYVTHNLGVVAQLCDRVAVMYAGELVEDAPLAELFRQPLHPYTQALMNSVPRLGESKQMVELQAIEGLPPGLGSRPEGCVFIDRCPLAIEICRQRPPLYNPTRARRTRCHRWMELAKGEAAAGQGTRQAARRAQPLVLDTEPPGLTLEDVSVVFQSPVSFRGLLAGHPRQAVRAVNHVNLRAWQGQTLGIVGESGSGKSTLARAIAGLVERTGGEIQLMGVTLPRGLSGRDLKTLQSLQMIFQNPEEAFNPHLTVGEALRRPFINLLGMQPAQADREVRRLISAVRLPEVSISKLPGQLSGGELQRAAIARAIAARPALALADEPVSALDVSVQAAILNLLDEIQIEQGNTLLFISHDLAVVGYLADEIVVTYLGHIMEHSSAEFLFQPPYHPYTEALLSAIPSLDPEAASTEIRLHGEIPSPAQIPSGCPFHTRCPRFLGQICVEVTPPWQVDPHTGKRFFCHIPPEELQAMQTMVV